MLVDASPLIYLAKIDALDVFNVADHRPLLTPEVERESARPGLAYEHSDSIVIAEALRSGAVERVDLSMDEIQVADRMYREAGGIGRGEAEVLAVALGRHLPVVMFERRAMRLARSMGLDVWTPIDLVFAGTKDQLVLKDRIRRFATLVDMHFADVQELMELAEEAEQ